MYIMRFYAGLAGARGGGEGGGEWGKAGAEDLFYCSVYCSVSESAVWPQKVDVCSDAACRSTNFH